MFKRYLYGLYIFREGEGVGGGGGDNPPPPSGNEDAPWYEKLGIDQKHHEFLRTKEFRGPGDVVDSYQSLQRTIGRQRLAVPLNAEDTTAYDAIYKTLGRPEAADGYKLPDGVNIKPEVWSKFAPVFHAAGVSQGAAEKIVSTFNDIVETGQAESEQEREARDTREEAELKKAWGGDYSKNEDLAKRAFRSIGLSDEESTAVENVVGFKRFLEIFHKIGAGMGEHDFKNDGKADDHGGTSVEAAKTKRDELLSDKNFLVRYQSPNQRTREQAYSEIEPYFKIIAEAKQDAKRVG